MPRSTFYYHLKSLKKQDKYKEIKEEIFSIFHENKGRYGYRRITLELRNRGYKIKYKKTFKEHVKNIFIILILILILFLVFQIPFVKNYFITIYSENELIKWIVDFFADVFK